MQGSAREEGEPSNTRLVRSPTSWSYSKSSYINTGYRNGVQRASRGVVRKTSPSPKKFLFHPDSNNHKLPANNSSTGVSFAAYNGWLSYLEVPKHKLSNSARRKNPSFVVRMRNGSSRRRKRSTSKAWREQNKVQLCSSSPTRSRSKSPKNNDGSCCLLSRSPKNNQIINTFNGRSGSNTPQGSDESDSSCSLIRAQSYLDGRSRLPKNNKKHKIYEVANSMRKNSPECGSVDATPRNYLHSRLGGALNIKQGVMGKIGSIKADLGQNSIRGTNINRAIQSNLGSKSFSGLNCIATAMLGLNIRNSLASCSGDRKDLKTAPLNRDQNSNEPSNKNNNNDSYSDGGANQCLCNTNEKSETDAHSEKVSSSAKMHRSHRASVESVKSDSGVNSNKCKQTCKDISLVSQKYNLRQWNPSDVVGNHYTKVNNTDDFYNVNNNSNYGNSSPKPFTKAKTRNPIVIPTQATENEGSPPESEFSDSSSNSEASRDHPGNLAGLVSINSMRPKSSSPHITDTESNISRDQTVETKNSQELSSFVDPENRIADKRSDTDRKQIPSFIYDEKAVGCAQKCSCLDRPLRTKRAGVARRETSSSEACAPKNLSTNPEKSFANRRPGLGREENGSFGCNRSGGICVQKCSSVGPDTRVRRRGFAAHRGDVHMSRVAKRSGGFSRKSSSVNPENRFSSRKCFTHKKDIRGSVCDKSVRESSDNLSSIVNGDILRTQQCCSLDSKITDSHKDCGTNREGFCMSRGDKKVQNCVQEYSLADKASKERKLDTNIEDVSNVECTKGSTDCLWNESALTASQTRWNTTKNDNSYVGTENLSNAAESLEEMSKHTITADRPSERYIGEPTPLLGSSAMKVPTPSGGMTGKCHKKDTFIIVRANNKITPLEALPLRIVYKSCPSGEVGNVQKSDFVKLNCEAVLKKVACPASGNFISTPDGDRIKGESLQTLTAQALMGVREGEVQNKGLQHEQSRVGKGIHSSPEKFLKNNDSRKRRCETQRNIISQDKRYRGSNAGTLYKSKAQMQRENQAQLSEISKQLSTDESVELASCAYSVSQDSQDSSNVSLALHSSNKSELTYCFKKQNESHENTCHRTRENEIAIVESCKQHEAQKVLPKPNSSAVYKVNCTASNGVDGTLGKTERWVLKHLPLIVANRRRAKQKMWTSQKQRKSASYKELMSSASKGCANGGRSSTMFKGIVSSQSYAKMFSKLTSSGESIDKVKNTVSATEIPNKNKLTEEASKSKKQRIIEQKSKPNKRTVKYILQANGQVAVKTKPNKNRHVKELSGSDKRRCNEEPSKPSNTACMEAGSKSNEHGIIEQTSKPKKPGSIEHAMQSKRQQITEQALKSIEHGLFDDAPNSTLYTVTHNAESQLLSGGKCQSKPNHMPQQDDLNNHQLEKEQGNKQLSQGQIHGLQHKKPGLCKISDQGDIAEPTLAVVYSAPRKWATPTSTSATLVRKASLKCLNIVPNESLKKQLRSNSKCRACSSAANTKVEREKWHKEELVDNRKRCPRGEQKRIVSPRGLQDKPAKLCKPAIPSQKTPTSGNGRRAKCTPQSLSLRSEGSSFLASFSRWKHKSMASVSGLPDGVFLLDGEETLVNSDLPLEAETKKMVKIPVAKTEPRTLVNPRITGKEEERHPGKNKTKKAGENRKKKAAVDIDSCTFDCHQKNQRPRPSIQSERRQPSCSPTSTLDRNTLSGRFSNHSYVSTLIDATWPSARIKMLQNLLMEDDSELSASDESGVSENREKKKNALSPSCQDGQEVELGSVPSAEDQCVSAGAQWQGPPVPATRSNPDLVASRAVDQSLIESTRHRCRVIRKYIQDKYACFQDVPKLYSRLVPPEYRCELRDILSDCNSFKMNAAAHWSATKEPRIRSQEVEITISTEKSLRIVTSSSCIDFSESPFVTFNESDAPGKETNYSKTSERYGRARIFKTSDVSPSKPSASSSQSRTDSDSIKTKRVATSIKQINREPGGGNINQTSCLMSSEISKLCTSPNVKPQTSPQVKISKSPLLHESLIHELKTHYLFERLGSRSGVSESGDDVTLDSDWDDENSNDEADNNKPSISNEIKVSENTFREELSNREIKLTWNNQPLPASIPLPEEMNHVELKRSIVFPVHEDYERNCNDLTNGCIGQGVQDESVARCIKGLMSEMLDKRLTIIDSSFIEVTDLSLSAEEIKTVAAESPQQKTATENQNKPLILLSTKTTTEDWLTNYRSTQLDTFNKILNDVDSGEIDVSHLTNEKIPICCLEEQHKENHSDVLESLLNSNNLAKDMKEDQDREDEEISKTESFTLSLHTDSTKTENYYSKSQHSIISYADRTKSISRIYSNALQSEEKEGEHIKGTIIDEATFSRSSLICADRGKSKLKLQISPSMLSAVRTEVQNIKENGSRDSDTVCLPIVLKDDQIKSDKIKNCETPRSFSPTKSNSSITIACPGVDIEITFKNQAQLETSTTGKGSSLVSMKKNFSYSDMTTSDAIGFKSERPEPALRKRPGTTPPSTQNLRNYGTGLCVPQIPLGENQVDETNHEAFQPKTERMFQSSLTLPHKSASTIENINLDAAQDEPLDLSVETLSINETFGSVTPSDIGATHTSPGPYAPCHSGKSQLVHVSLTAPISRSLHALPIDLSQCEVKRSQTICNASPTISASTLGKSNHTFVETMSQSLVAGKKEQNSFLTSNDTCNFQTRPEYAKFRSSTPEPRPRYKRNNRSIFQELHQPHHNDHDTLQEIHPMHGHHIQRDLLARDALAGDTSTHYLTHDHQSWSPIKTSVNEKTHYVITGETVGIDVQKFIGTTQAGECGYIEDEETLHRPKRNVWTNRGSSGTPRECCTIRLTYHAPLKTHFSPESVSFARRHQNTSTEKPSLWQDLTPHVYPRANECVSQVNVAQKSSPRLSQRTVRRMNAHGREQELFSNASSPSIFRNSQFKPRYRRHSTGSPNARRHMKYFPRLKAEIQHTGNDSLEDETSKIDAYCSETVMGSSSEYYLHSAGSENLSNKNSGIFPPRSCRSRHNLSPASSECSFYSCSSMLSLHRYPCMAGYFYKT